jgi:arylsulfatase A-like enzyme
MHRPEDVELPASRTLDFHGKPWWHEATSGLDLPVDPRMVPDSERLEAMRVAWRGFTRDAPDTEQQLRHTIVNYYGMISLVDHQIGRVVEALRDRKLLDDTLLIFTSDHGELLGDHGWITKGATLYDGLVRVPLILSGPGVKTGETADAPVSTVDLYSTILEAASARLPEIHQSESLWDVLEGRGDRMASYLEWKVDRFELGQDEPIDLRMARTRDRKLVIDLISGDGELYDLVTDPHETTNVFHDSAYRNDRERLTDYIRSVTGHERETPLERVGIA